MLRGRVMALNGVAVDKIAVRPEGAWVLRGDRGITYATTMPENATLSAGNWWPADYQGEPLVSFSADLKQANGVFESVRIGSMQTVPGDSFLTPEVTARIICRFDSGERNGSARFVLSPAPGRWTLVPLLVELRIDDGDGEELVLPQGITP